MASAARRPQSRSRTGTGRPRRRRCMCPCGATNAAGQRWCWAYQILGLVQLGFPEKVTARAGSTIRLPETSQTRGGVSRPPWRFLYSTVERHRSRKVLEVVGPLLPPDRASDRGSPWRPRMKEYLQCAQRAGLSGGSDARSIASSVRSLWLARFVFSPSEIDQWQNRPRPAFCFSDQTIRKRDVRIVGRECSS